MPSKSPAQKRLMQAAAHTKGGFGGVPQKVGKEFVAADKDAKSPNPATKRKDASAMRGRQSKWKADLTAARRGGRGR